MFGMVSLTLPHKKALKATKNQTFSATSNFVIRYPVTLARI